MILLTGSTGTIGKEVVKQLAARNVKFRALVRKSSDAEILRAQGVDAIVGDLSQRASLQRVLQGVSRVFLLSPSSPWQVALEGTVVDEAKRAGVQHVVKLSVLGANSQSSATLLKWHGQVEQMIEASGLAYTHLRPNSFIQNLAAFYGQSVSQQGAIYAPQGDEKVSWVDTRDIAAVAATVLTQEGHEGRTYDITGPESLSYGHVAEKLSSLLGKRVTYVSVSDAAAKQAMTESGVPEWFAHAIVTLYHFYRQGNGRLVAGTVEMLTGKQPRTVSAYLEENIQAFRG